MSLSNINNAIEDAVLIHVEEAVDDCFYCYQCGEKLDVEKYEMDTHNAVYEKIILEPCEKCLEEKDSEIERLITVIEKLKDEMQGI